jgi:uncharacterized membrane protein
MGALASLMLSIEALWSAGHPDAVYSCDISAKVSCSKVAASWQSTLLNISGKPVPNAFIGLMAFPLIMMLGVLIMSKVSIPKWMTWCVRIGMAGAFVFAAWLSYQSAVVIGALCPWCLTMFTGILLDIWVLWRMWAIRFGRSSRLSYKFADSAWSLMVPVLMVTVIVFYVIMY